MAIERVEVIDDDPDDAIELHDEGCGDRSLGVVVLVERGSVGGRG